MILLTVQANTLINRRNRVQQSLSHTQSLKMLTQTKIERLKQAKLEVSNLIARILTVSQKMQSYTIPAQSWRGMRKNEFDTGSRTKMNATLSQYNKHVSDLNSQIDDEIQRLLSQIDMYNSQIASYQHTIAYLNTEISNARRVR